MADCPLRLALINNLLREEVQALKAGGARCTCDLDNWEPEPGSGHSWVCGIHKAAHRAVTKIVIREKI